MFNKYSNDKKGNFWKLLKTKLLLLALLVLIIFFGYHFWKTKKRQNEVDGEVLELQKQIENFEEKNKKLEQLSQYLKTDDFKEKEAKEKLNLIKEGEKVIIVKKSEVEDVVDSKKQTIPDVKIDRPNYYYWWHYFFGIEPETKSINSFEEQIQF